VKGTKVKDVRKKKDKEANSFAPKASKRSRCEFPALEKKFNLLSRVDEIDYDYVGKLSKKEKDWLNRFTEEYTNANFNHKGNILHKTKGLKKSCYDRNNARNRDRFNREKAMHTLYYFSELENYKKKS
jgi:hypothetical protein